MSCRRKTQMSTRISIVSAHQPPFHNWWSAWSNGYELSTQLPSHRIAVCPPRSVVRSPLRSKSRSLYLCASHVVVCIDRACHDDCRWLTFHRYHGFWGPFAAVGAHPPVPPAAPPSAGCEDAMSRVCPIASFTSYGKIRLKPSMRSQAGA